MSIAIAGEAGSIEAEIDPVPGSKSGAVLCHPHPLYGGSMDDGVLASVADGFTGAGVSTLRFNFRGVGQSEGLHDQGAGEVLDVVTVADWFARESDLSSCFLGGYSFGAAIALRAASGVKPRGIVLVAPPVQMLSGLAPPLVPTLVILGALDQIVSEASASEYFSEVPAATVHVIVGADHFFGGYGAEIRDLVRGFVGGI